MNLDFSIIYTRPVMDDACFYCGVPIRGKHILVTFERGINKFRLHIEPDSDCWDNFVLGVNLVNSNLQDEIHLGQELGRIN